jgi:hypothetical protein
VVWRFSIQSKRALAKLIIVWTLHAYIQLYTHSILHA